MEATGQNQTYVFDGADAERELERLRLLESVFDPGTRRCLLATGLQPGWRGLEVGAGAGSIADWMADVTSPGGRIVAVDTNTRFLRGLMRSNLEIIETDIATANLAAGSFDVVHARFVLIHVPDPDALLKAMLRALKPGGYLVVEEPDFSESRSLTGAPHLRAAFARVHRAVDAMFIARGLDPTFGAHLPEMAQVYGLRDISIDHDAAIVPGGSPMARMIGLSAWQLRAHYVATGLATEADIEHYRAFTLDPHAWATYHGTVRVSARTP